MCNTIMFLIFGLLNKYPQNLFEKSLNIHDICLLGFIVTNLFETPAAISFLQHYQSKCLSFEECAPIYTVTLAFYDRYSFCTNLTEHFCHTFVTWN